MTITEGTQVRLRVDVTGIRGTRVPAGTVGVVVDDAHAPHQYAVDVQVDGRNDNVAVSGEQIQAASE